MQLESQPKSGDRQPGTKSNARVLSESIINFAVDGQSSISSRRKIVRRIFGHTTKSPFVWSLPASADKSLIHPIQKLHDLFWNQGNGNKIESTVQSIQQESIALSSADDILTLIAIATYCPRAQVTIADAAEKSEPGLLYQLQEIELPIWGCLLDATDSDATDSIQELVRHARLMESLIEDLLDGDGWLKSPLFSEFGLLAASWCRCQKILSSKGYHLDSNAISQLDWMCQQLIRSLRFDGSLIFGEPGTGANCAAFRKAILELSTDSTSRSLAASCYPKSKKHPRSKRKRLPAESSISESSQAGVLQKQWLRGSPKVGFLFGDHRMQLEIAHRFVLISGDCTPQIKIDDQQQPTTSEVGVTGNLRSDHADYVELELDYGEWVLQRQLLLLRDDDLFLLADNVVGKQTAKIEYSCSYPIGSQSEAVAETENTEIYICQESRYGLVIPLAISEWKTAISPDHFVIKNGELTLNQSINGKGLSAPLVFDLNPKRSIKPRTWRRLTVAEQMETVGLDIAAAYRLQIGKQQWLFYRSIAEKGNRTFLGQNYACDFFVGRIALDGAIEPLLEVE